MCMVFSLGWCLAEGHRIGNQCHTPNGSRTTALELKVVFVLLIHSFSSLVFQCFIFVRNLFSHYSVDFVNIVHINHYWLLLSILHMCELCRFINRYVSVRYTTSYFIYMITPSSSSQNFKCQLPPSKFSILLHSPKIGRRSAVCCPEKLLFTVVMAHFRRDRCSCRLSANLAVFGISLYSNHFLNCSCVKYKALLKNFFNFRVSLAMHASLVV